MRGSLSQTHYIQRDNHVSVELVVRPNRHHDLETKIADLRHRVDRDNLRAGASVMPRLRALQARKRYRGIYNGRRVIFMNADDMKAAGLQQGELVDLTSHFGEGEQRSARHFQVAPYLLPRGCTATYFPEANVLVPINSVAERSNTPTSKFVIISIDPSPDAEVAARSVIGS